MNTNNVGQIDKAQSMWGAILETQADIACVTELGLDTTQISKVNRLLKRSRNDWIRNQGNAGNHYRQVKHRTVRSSSPYERQNISKPGGTMTVIQGALEGRIAQQDSDRAGRWSHFTINRGDSSKITVITAYQPCKPTQQGEFTVWEQQVQFFREQGADNVNPRQRFISDLTEFIKERIADGDEILLAGDFNETMEETHSGIADLAEQTGLTDIYFASHSSDEEPLETFGTHIRSQSRRIDFALATEFVAATVTSCGYLPYQSHMDTDHRMMFVDFDSATLIGSLVPPEPAGRRYIDSKHLKNLTSYLRALLKYGKSHKLLDRLEWMNDCPDRFSSEGLEACDRDLVRAFKHGENNCQKQFPEEHSHAMRQATNTVCFYRVCICRMRNKVDFSKKLAQTNRLLDIPLTPPSSLAEAQQLLRQSKQSLFQLRKNHAEERLKMLNDQALSLDYAITGNCADDAKRLAALKRATETRQMNRKFNANKATGRTGLQQLDIPADEEAWTQYRLDPMQCDNWRTLSSAGDIAEALIQRNRDHFGQAHGTPFTVPPLSSDLGYTGHREGADLILEGLFDTSALDNSTALLIEHLERKPDSVELKGTITVQEFKAKIRSWKESTSTSVKSGMHLGHYKALVAKHAYSRVDIEHGKPADVAAREELDEAQDYFLRVHVAILNLAITHQYSLNRWQEIINVMLRKDPDNCRLNRLRVIHLYEADYNLLLGVKWRSAVHQATDQGNINKGQFGSISGGMTWDPVFLEDLYHELSRLTRKPRVAFSNDAKSCFDRILLALATLVSRKYGVNKHVTLVTAKTLKEAKYRIKTELGISESHYSHCEIMPIYGIGQGSQNGPAYWVFISSTLFDCHATRAHGASYQSADGSVAVTIHLVSFVDDTYSDVNVFDAPTPPSPETLIEMMRHDAQSWSDLLWASGGKLELYKCAYYLICWAFTKNGAPVLKAGTHGPPLILNDPETNQPVEIPRLRTGEAHKILGHYREPTGSETTHFKKLQAKCKQHKQQIRSLSVSHSEAACHYFSRHIPAIVYPLGSSFLSDSRLDTLQRICGQSYINQMGYYRGTAKAIIYGPAQMGGRALRLYKVEQGINQILNFLRHWRNPSAISDTLRITVSWFQFSIGTSFSAFENTWTPIPNMEGKLLPSLRQNLDCSKCQLQLDNDYVVTPQREDDRWIMDRVLASPNFTSAQKAMVNYCRLFLRVTTLSDIAHPSGMRIDPTFEKGQTSLLSSTAKFHAVHQERPGAAAWAQWRRALRLFSGANGIISGKKLGRWLKPAKDLRRHWPAYLDAASSTLFVRTASGYQAYEWHEPHRCYVASTSTELQPSISSGSPVQIDSTRFGWRITHNPGVISIPQKPAYTDFTSFLRQLEPWEQAPFSHVEMRATPEKVWQKLFTADYCPCGSDGSVQEPYASFGWVLADEEKVYVAVGGLVHGKEPTSFRAEAYGVLSFLRFASRLCDYVNKKANLRSPLHSDSKSVIQRVDKYRDYHHLNGNASLHSDWDVIQEIYLSSNDLGFTLPLWVKGHQDDSRPYSELLLPAKLNCKADALANLMVRQAKTHPIDLIRPATVPRLPHNRVQLVRVATPESPRQTITRAYAENLRFFATLPAIQDYMMTRFEWSPPDTYNYVDWAAHATFVKRHKHQRTTLTKMLFFISPTNRRVHRYDPLRPETCPYCSEIETDNHMLLCQCKKEWRNATMKQIREACDRLDTHIDLQTILMESLHHWLNGGSADPSIFPDQYLPLLEQQSEIGWDHLFRGRLSTEWARIQNAHYRSLNDDMKRTGENWVASISATLFSCWFNMWDKRCKLVHGDDERAQAERQRERAISELKMLYSVSSTVPDRFHDMYISMAEQLAKPTIRIKDWISLHGPMIRKYVRAKARRNGQSTRAIWDYFQPTDLPTHQQTNTTDPPPDVPASTSSTDTWIYSSDGILSNGQPSLPLSPSTTSLPSILPTDSDSESDSDSDDSTILINTQLWTDVESD